jgi:hypothetical protein
MRAHIAGKEAWQKRNYCKAHIGNCERVYSEGSGKEHNGFLMGMALLAPFLGTAKAKTAKLRHTFQQGSV